ncbi:MAG: hypothetical protein GY937_16875 [bacterium]|nr:hypothetical protein [bacterium]
MKTPSWFDPRAGFWGALVMGSLVALINASHGYAAAATSAGKQAIYTFFFGGLIIQLCARLAARPGRQAPILAVAIGVPSVVTIFLIYLVHNLRGTPEPLLSTAAVACIAVPSFTVWSRKIRTLTGDQTQEA